MRTTSALLCFFLILSACTLPRILILTDPLDAKEYNDLGVSYEAAGKLELAADAYTTAAQKDQSWDQPLLNCGNVYAAQNLWPKAETCFRQALKRNPHNSEAMNNLAYALLAQGQPIKALDWINLALDLAPDDLIFQTTKAQALLEAGNKDLALQLLRDILATLPAADPLHQQISAIYQQLASPRP